MRAMSTESVPALDKGLTILEELAISKAGRTLPELVQSTGLPKSSVHSLLVTFERRGYIHRNDRTSRYMFGLRLFNLTDTALPGLRLREQAAPYLCSLMLKTRLTTHLGIMENHQAALVAKFELLGVPSFGTWVGKRMDLHSTSLGKAIIAHLPEHELEFINRERGLQRHNENTICSRKRLKEDLARCLHRGYAIDDEEDQLGSRCLGAPIFGRENRVIASISVCGTSAQIATQNLPELSRELIQTANAISNAVRINNSDDDLLRSFSSPRSVNIVLNETV
jgi:DNA-binding IclR family transcriptional regulator